MTKFVGVRIVQANGLDLSLFQFDWDLTFAVFFMNADKAVYGRFGTRSDHHDAERDISFEGFNKAMAGALALHADYPNNKDDLVGKIGPAPRHKVPEQYPTLTQFKPKFDLQAKGHNCMHCHQVGAAERAVHRTAGKPVPDDILFPYPMPDVLGLKLDPKEKATIVRVAPDSAASQAGFRAGDELLKLNGQPLLSIADVQWVLHAAGDEATLKAEVRRGEETRSLALSLRQGWRRRGEISWRTTTWDLRRMGTGGLVLEETPDDVRRKLGLEPSSLALRIKHVGQFGPHAAARDAGFRVGDIVVKFDGHEDAWSESELLAHAVQRKKPRDRVPVTVLRGGKKLELTLPMQ
jgi:hypothetical protein